MHLSRKTRSLQMNDHAGILDSGRQNFDRVSVKTVPIVTYHNVGPERPGVHPLLTVSPDRFEAQIRWLIRRGYSSIDCSDWIAWLTEGRPIPSKAVLITFDDGYEDITKYALPILSRYGFKSVVYIVTGLIGKTNEWDLRAGWGELKLMSEEQIMEWASKGVEFGSHTRHHPDLRNLSETELRDEICGSATDLETILNTYPSSFAYPYGYFNETAREFAARTYCMSVTQVEAICSDRDEPSLIPRIWVRPNEELSPFGRRVRSGKMEPMWKAAARRVPGIIRIRRTYLGLSEQWNFLSRVARERYAGHEALFDDYQEDYSHEAAPEQERYQIILDNVAGLCGSRWGNVLEIGCSKGSFTTRLAAVCDSIVACDISPRACNFTSDRCKDFANIKVRRLDIQRDTVMGQFDLVFVMDTLAYVHGRRRLAQTIRKLIQVIRPGGLLIFCEVCWPESIRDAWWQRWLPEGADAHLAALTNYRELTLLYEQRHRKSNEPLYMDHLIAIFSKNEDITGRRPEKRMVRHTLPNAYALDRPQSA
jgi:peptidoglycan/xylan/chitin deacetylase (PgdA/CDA1 family)/trans-aconitate methyltransferase